MLCLWGDRARERVNGQFGIHGGIFVGAGLPALRRWCQAMLCSSVTCAGKPAPTGLSNGRRWGDIQFSTRQCQWGYFCRCGLARAAAVVLGNVVSIGNMRGQARTYRGNIRYSPTLPTPNIIFTSQSQEQNHDVVPLLFVVARPVPSVGVDYQGYINGPALTSSFYFPLGVAVDAVGSVYVADTMNSQIRKIFANP